MKLKAIDLFCGAGGVSLGLVRAGFEVAGVDMAAQPNYPFKFTKEDALNIKIAELRGADFIWASPPCQKFSDLAKRNGNAADWPDLIEPIRKTLQRSGVPYCIENVEGAPLWNPVTLCGTMFPGLRVLRHRLFECSFPVTAPEHGKHPLVHTHDKRKAHHGKTDQTKDFVQVTGGGNCSVAAARQAMGISWMTKEEINEAIPPAYSEFIGLAARRHILSLQQAA